MVWEGGLYNVAKYLIIQEVMKRALVPLLMQYQKSQSANDPFINIQIESMKGPVQVNEVKLLEKLKSLFEKEQNFTTNKTNRKS